ncbi:MAG: hypothetical protein ACFFF4_09725 [Candidatus Thorarchaeota archaeon]
MELRKFWKLIAIIGIMLFLMGLISFPAMEYIMQLIIQDSGWPYWPPIYPGPRNFIDVAGSLGIFIRDLYINRFYILGIGIFLVILAGMLGHREFLEQS